MKICITGQSGFIGKHVVKAALAREHSVVDFLHQNPDALIHLAWDGLPNYENVKHFNNLWWNLSFLHAAVNNRIRNITVTGTCLETVRFPPYYAIAKLAVRARLFELLPTAKWARLWYLYGEGQREPCLLPSFKRAQQDNYETFSVVDGARDFIDVALVAYYLVLIAEQNSVNGIIDVCSGVAEPVKSFLERQPGRKLKLVDNYPAQIYEPHSFHGDREKLETIVNRAEQ